MDKEKLTRVEQMLRAERRSLLSAGFTATVMAEVKTLPDPELLRPARSWRDFSYVYRLMGPSEKIAAALILAGGAMLFIPGLSEMLAIIEWEMSDVSVALNIGETAISASLVTIVAFVLCALMFAGIGALGGHNKLTVS